MKPPPRSTVALEILDQILNDGFVTAGDVLLVTQPQELLNEEAHPILHVGSSFAKPLRSFSLGYVKGMARCTTLLSLLHWCAQEGVNLKVVHPRLYASCLRLFIQYFPQSSKRMEAIKKHAIKLQGVYQKGPRLDQYNVHVLRFARPRR